MAVFETSQPDGTIFMFKAVLVVDTIFFLFATPLLSLYLPYFLWSIGNGRGDGKGANDRNASCGNRTLNRIIGGTVAPEGAWPWQAMIMKRYGLGFMEWCGGTLIHPNWVVTAAHCVKGVVPEIEMKIRLDE